MNEAYRAWASAGGRGGVCEPDGSQGLVHIQLLAVLSVFESDLVDIIEHYKSRGAFTVNATAGFLINPSIGAKASTGSGEDFIGINIGTFLWMSELYVRICKFNGCLMVNSTDHQTEFDQYLPDKIDMYQAITELGFFQGLDANNTLRITEILILSSRYILHHELAHIWNGHLGWKAATANGSSKIDQVNVHQINRAFESDADARACWAALRHETPCIFHSKTGEHYDDNSYRYFLNAPNLGEINKTFEQQAYSYAISIYLLWRLIIFKTGNINSSGSHPSSTSRLVCLFEDMYRIWAIGTNQLPQRVETILRFAFYCGEEAFSAVSKQPKLDLKAFVDQAMLDRREAFVTWNSIANEVKPFLIGLENAEFNIENFDAERPVIVEILNRIFSSEEQHQNYFEALAVDIEYYSTRLLYSSESSIPMVRPSTSYKNLETLIYNFSQLEVIAQKFIDTTNVNAIALWLQYLEHVRIFQKEFKTLMEDDNEIWLGSKYTIEFSDGLVRYFTAASELSEDNAVLCIKREDLFGFEELGLADTVKLARCGHVLWDAQPFCLQSFEWAGFQIRPQMNVVPVPPDKSIRTVSGAMYAVMPFFRSITSEVALAYRGFK